MPINAPEQLGRIVGIFADVHGAERTLAHALADCRAAGVEQIALLGDLFDREEQADACARALAEWPTIGVWGNHEREIVQRAADHGRLARATVRLLTGLAEELFVDDVCLIHEAPQWGRAATLARLASPMAPSASPPEPGAARITFAGHTHHRAARDERGPLDLGRGVLTLAQNRRYLINPGALLAGQYAIWNRETDVVRFCQTG
ncbi:MAG TPA: metallophosphoesterase family protein [Thermomicrobiales bacterium]